MGCALKHPAARATLSLAALAARSAADEPRVGMARPQIPFWPVP
jgi:hypothetical protein